MIKYRVTFDNVIGDHVVGKQELLFDAESLNRWLEDRASGPEYQTRRLFGLRVPAFHIESVDTTPRFIPQEEDSWRRLMT